MLERRPKMEKLWELVLPWLALLWVLFIAYLGLLVVVATIGGLTDGGSGCSASDQSLCGGFGGW